MEVAEILALIKSLAPIVGNVLALAAKVKETASESDVAAINAETATLIPVSDADHAALQKS